MFASACSSPYTRHKYFMAFSPLWSLAYAQLAELLDRRALREVVELEILPHLDLGHAAVDRRIGEALGPLDRFLARLDVDHRVAGDELLRFRERAVDEAPLSSVVLDAPALFAALQAGGIDQDAGLGELLVIGTHLREQAFRWHLAGFGIPGGLDQNHEFHRFLLGLNGFCNL